MMNSTKNQSQFIKQILILSSSTIIAIAVISICIWLYYSMRNEVEKKVNNNIESSTVLIKQLIQLKKKELTSLANSISEGPLFKSAMVSVHNETIEDVLNDLAKINNLNFIAVIEGKFIKYSNFKDVARGEKINSITSAHFLGVKNINGKKMRMVIGEKISSKLISTWEEMTKSHIITTDKSYKILLSPLSHKEMSMPNQESLSQITIKNTPYYMKAISLFKNSYHIHVLKTKSHFWNDFYKKRNSLIFLGVALFFFGIILSTLTANLIVPILNKNSKDNPDDIIDMDQLISEIEECKRKIISP